VASACGGQVRFDLCPGELTVYMRRSLMPLGFCFI
jgi:hypothetical protein